MKAMLITENHDLVWKETETPTVRADEVLVRVYAAGVNRADLLQREGKYPSPAGCPPWCGLEIAGEIVTVGEDVGRWHVGDRVCALLGGGGYAEYAAVRWDMLMPVPAGLSMEEAASLPEAFATSYLNLFHEGHMECGQTVYISAGASGLSSVAVPMAKAFGARVITSVRREEQVAYVRDLGADRVILSTSESVAEIFRQEEAAGRPVHLAMDCLGGEGLGECLPYMAKGGYWILISTLAGVETTVPLRPLLTKGLHLAGSMLRNRTPAFKAALLAELVDRVWDKIEQGVIRPTVSRVFPITEANEAHAYLQRGGNTGKVVLHVPS